MRALRNRHGERGAAQQAYAFTLIELLTVISILALLIAILLPSLNSARQAAKAKVCLSHLKGIGNLFAIYLDENDSRFPPVRLERPRASSALEQFYINDAQRAAPRWQWFLESDVGPVVEPHPFGEQITSIGFFFDGSPGTGKAGGPMQMTSELYTCPTLVDPLYANHIRDGAYGYNYQYLGNTYQEHTPNRWDNFAVGQQQIRNPGKTVMVADSRGAGFRHGKHSYTLDPPRLATEVRANKFGPRTSSFDPQDFEGYDLGSLNATIYSYSPAEPRHSGRANVVFADMHGEGVTPVELGYELSDGSDPDIPKGVPLPVHDPLAGTYSASNRMWNGDGSDQIAEQHKPSP